MPPVHAAPSPTLFAKFGEARQGSVAPIFALLLVTMVAFAGLAMDSSRAERYRARLSEAADAAILAAARAAASMQEAEPARRKEEIAAIARDVGAKHFNSNTSQLSGLSTDKLELRVYFENGQWAAQADYAATAGTTLMSSLGTRELKITGKAEANLAPGFPVLDIAMCVDRTGSMFATLEAVKANALNFFDRINTELAAKGMQQFPLVRVRMLYFQDFGDGFNYADPDPLVTSGFFSLPDQQADFVNFVSPVTIGYGGDWPESGLECLNDAMNSPWTKVGDQPAGFSERVTDVYPLIVIWTDAPAHPIGFPNSLANPHLPERAPRSRTTTPAFSRSGTIRM